jgi:hypothetical protein
LPHSFLPPNAPSPICPRKKSPWQIPAAEWVVWAEWIIDLLRAGFYRKIKSQLLQKKPVNQKNAVLFSAAFFCSI